MCLSDIAVLSINRLGVVTGRVVLLVAGKCSPDLYVGSAELGQRDALMHQCAFPGRGHDSFTLLPSFAHHWTVTDRARFVSQQQSSSSFCSFLADQGMQWCCESCAGADRGIFIPERWIKCPLIGAVSGWTQLRESVMAVFPLGSLLLLAQL